MIEVLRLGHRAGRDDRISTHVGLVARQWGAERIVYAGEHDSSMMESIEDIVERWGGPFDVEYTESPVKRIKEFDGTVVHLTMYGVDLGEEQEVLREETDEDLLVVVGAEKVSRNVYKAADHNIAVGHQPHSEIAALAVFMDRIEGIRDEFDNAQLEVEPSKDRKLTREL